MKVSVIISTYTNERFRDVLRCVESINNQTLKPYEILLVLDPVEKLVEFYKNAVPSYVKVVVSDGFGLSEARNKGVVESRGDILAFIDDDAWAEETWLEKIVENYYDETIYGVGGRILPVFEGERPKWLPEELDWIVGCTYKGLPEQKTQIRNPIGANMSFRREAFEIAGLFRSEVGRYGKKLLSGEEAEFAMRLRKLKPDARIIYEPSAIVYHKVSKSRTKVSYAVKRAFYEGYSKAILSKDYFLEAETKYFVFIIKSILKKLLSKGRQPEAFGMVLIVVAVGLGNLYGRFRILGQ